MLVNLPYRYLPASSSQSSPLFNWAYKATRCSGFINPTKGNSLNVQRAMNNAALCARGQTGWDQRYVEFFLLILCVPGARMHVPDIRGTRTMALISYRLGAYRVAVVWCKLLMWFWMSDLVTIVVNPANCRFFSIDYWSDYLNRCLVTNWWQWLVVCDLLFRFRSESCFEILLSHRPRDCDSILSTDYRPPKQRLTFPITYPSIQAQSAWTKSIQTVQGTLSSLLKWRCGFVQTSDTCC